MDNDMGASPSGPGHSAEPEPPHDCLDDYFEPPAGGVSALRASVPSAALFDFEAIWSIYQAGIRRGTEEATALEWGCRPSGKEQDELVEQLYYTLNGETRWGEPGFFDYDAIEMWVAQAIEARRAETAKTGSIEDESAVPKGCAQGEQA